MQVFVFKTKIECTLLFVDSIGLPLWQNNDIPTSNLTLYNFSQHANTLTIELKYLFHYAFGLPINASTTVSSTRGKFASTERGRLLSKFEVCRPDGPLLSYNLPRSKRTHTRAGTRAHAHTHRERDVRTHTKTDWTKDQQCTLFAGSRGRGRGSGSGSGDGGERKSEDSIHWRSSLRIQGADVEAKSKDRSWTGRTPKAADAPQSPAPRHRLQRRRRRRRQKRRRMDFPAALDPRGHAAGGGGGPWQPSDREDRRNRRRRRRHRLRGPRLSRTEWGLGSHYWHRCRRHCQWHYPILRLDSHATTTLKGLTLDSLPPTSSLCSAFSLAPTADYNLLRLLPIARLLILLRLCK
jgi:hypothetical protein